MEFLPRLTAPTMNNKHFYSDNIYHLEGWGMPNCTCYAWGRFYEIIGSKPKFLGNAEDWWGYPDGYKRGQVPKLGAVVCWRKGTAGDNSDGAGHVAIVEQINSDESILISQSAYNGTLFWTQTLKTPYIFGSAYTLQGFIYPPIEFGCEGGERNMFNVKVGDLVTIKDGAVYSTGKTVPGWVRAKNWYVDDVSQYPFIKIDKSEDGANAIRSLVDIQYLELAEEDLPLVNTMPGYYSTKEDAKTMWDVLHEFGMTNDYAKAAMLAQFDGESGLRSMNLQQTSQEAFGETDESYTTKVDMGILTNFAQAQAGYGLCQWTWHTRKQGLLDRARAEGVSIGDMWLQLKYCWHELTTGYKSTLEKIQKATSVREASNVLLFEFEAPADQGQAQQDRRASYAQAYYDRFHVKEVQPSKVYTNIILDKDLKAGDSGETVKLLQIRIAQISPEFDVEVRGHSFDVTGQPDGVFGAGMTATIKRVQEQAELPITGILDVSTRYLLNDNVLILHAKNKELYQRVLSLEKKIEAAQKALE